jgi:hypothetical protein
MAWIIPGKRWTVGWAADRGKRAAVAEPSVHGERGDFRMSRLRRRLAVLDRALKAPVAAAQATALALDTGGDDLMLVGQEWLPCPDVHPILARRNPAVKVYLGFTAEEL